MTSYNLSQFSRLYAEAVATLVTSKKVRLEWAPPAERGAPIKSYVIERQGQQ
jgi:hypothetical protein